MNGRSARRSSLFLLELMISVLMFSVSSAWCVRLFVTARSIVSETDEQTKAGNLAAGYAEVFLASDDFEAFLLSEGGIKTEMSGNGGYRIFYDKNWKGCEEADAVFYLDAVIAGEGKFEKCSLGVSKEKGEDLIYLLDVEKYTGGEAAL